MNNAEFLELFYRYRKSDSVSERDHLIDEASDACREALTRAIAAGIAKIENFGGAACVHVDENDEWSSPFMVDYTEALPTVHGGRRTEWRSCEMTPEMFDLTDGDWKFEKRRKKIVNEIESVEIEISENDADIEWMTKRNEKLSAKLPELKKKLEDFDRARKENENRSAVNSTPG